MAKRTFVPETTVVAVKWNDAWYSDFDHAEHEPLLLEVVGHVLQHTAAGIRLSMERSVGPNAGPRQIKFIPAGMIAGIEILRK